MNEFKPDITPLFTVANQILVNFFKQECAQNFIAHSIEDKDTGEEYIISMQKVSGETPLHQLEKANDRIKILEQALAKVLDLLQADSEHFGEKRLEITERIRDHLHRSPE